MRPSAELLTLVHGEVFFYRLGYYPYVCKLFIPRQSSIVECVHST